MRPCHRPGRLRTALCHSALSLSLASAAGCATGPPEPLVEPDTPIVVTAGPSAYLHGIGAVSPQGEYQYTIPIWLPKGRAEMQPSLALEYSSRRGDHVMGVGWSLGGVSQIHACPKTFFVDGSADGIDRDPSDALCLDGKKLVSVGGNEYRTVPDEFVRVVGQKNEFFTVYRKDGSIARYLALSASWPISWQRDRAGNEIRYQWDEKTARLDGIEYTGHEDDEGAAPFHLAFHYKPRSHVLKAYVAGTQTRSRRRAGPRPERRRP
jgi:Salmonella virulence plasmid 65kDa B protein